MTTRREALRLLTSEIRSIYGEREAATIARMVLSARSGISESALLADPAAEIEIPDFEDLAQELGSGRPVQYIVGHTEFCGLEFRVREGVLIPRPETEELVGHILRKHPSARHILDIGTGSGCIAIALKKALPEAQITALDLSDEALEIARENSERLGAGITLIKGDALCGESYPEGPFEVIVSNPPYIPQSEERLMRRNVLDFEPHEALFVPDSDPLRFYRAIGSEALKRLTPTGSLWFEVHEDFADLTAEMLAGQGYSRVEVLRDLFDKKRMIWSRP
ncbi:MAG: peptide chain release factor N(5)-glutamine methyltransferase [Rikenellaceae bacterium]|nr:peptide chain release factor N(5)-glutamine methyltransferase [Rikenellaceae bacterium]